MMLPKEPSNYERQLVALGRALQAFREEATVEGVIRVALEHIKAEFDYALVWIGLYDRVEHRLSGKGGFCPNGETALLKQRISLNPGDLLEQAVIQQRPLGVPDLRDEPRSGEWRRLAQRFGIQGTVILPIRHKDRCFGLLLLGATLWGASPYTEEKARLSMILGGLAEALDQLELEQQRRQAKRPDQPLFALLSRLRTSPNLKKRLEAVVEETHRFIAPSRTNIYWYEPQQRYFWRRSGNRNTNEQSAADSIPIQNLGSFYQALAADQIVSIGEAQSSLKGDTTGRLMQQIQARSLIAAPILHQNELLGFIAVEGAEARIWLEEEKTYLRGVAQLLALAAPLEEVETTIQQVKQDQLLTSEVTRALYSESDWKATLRRSADEILRRLKVERFLVLFYNADLKKFEIRYQQQPQNRKPIAVPFEQLNPVDWQMLERSTEAVGIENLSEDLKLMSWRQTLLTSGIQSLLVCQTTIGKPIEALILIGHEATRSWSRAERELLKVVSQQLGLLLHQLQLQSQTEQLQKTYQSVQWGLTTMQQIQQLERLEKSAIQHIAQLLQAPLATLITWRPGRSTAQVTAPLVTKIQFGLNVEAAIPLNDPLLQIALQNDNLQPLSISEIGLETRRWLTGSNLGQVIVYALRTAPEHEPMGIILVADQAERVWLQHQLNAFGILANQLAWCRRSLILTEMLLAQRNSLEQLNWYKHHRLEEIYRILGVGVRRLNELSHQKDALSGMRYQQVLRHLGNTLSATTPLLKQEQWQLQNDSETIPIASLLKRTLERLDSLIKQRQLWTQVHNEANLSTGGDVPKLELIVHEIITSACLRSPLSGRLDIWCRQIDASWLELSITDHGKLEPHLIEQLGMGRASDLLTPSILDQAPGLHFAICQSLMQQMGGDFGLEQLEDGRTLSRLMMPIATNVPSQLRSEHEMSGFF
jgi:GAF domain-containing protein